MSVYGGDSWAREAQYRKRRVDDLIMEGVEASAYKKLSNGKFACLVCPNNPVLDTPTILSTHVNGSRHRLAESRRKDKELAKQEEMNKRIAMSNCVNSNIAPDSSVKKKKTASKPLIDLARKAASEVFSARAEVKSEMVSSVVPFTADCGSNGDAVEIESLHKGVVLQSLDYRERLEKELKFTASGWKRDCHGKWFKDENVEFDSDEEDPNIVLNEALLDSRKI
ncbi:hypothetical protein ACJIZ3_001341 [Penstemon smallii]|uniref:Sodium channel modifier 1 n=1 Tax=Penstemon smallii TaxID=265156 RepID=A0ABD3U5S4_9LAMI